MLVEKTYIGPSSSVVAEVPSKPVPPGRVQCVCPSASVGPSRHPAGARMSRQVVRARNSPKGLEGSTVPVPALADTGEDVGDD